ncbi:MAG: M48 family metallopeptidase [Acidobacteriota bacterium]
MRWCARALVPTLVALLVAPSGFAQTAPRPTGPAKAQTAAPAASSSDAEPSVVTVTDPDLFQKSLEAAHEALQQFGGWDEPRKLRHVADIGYRLVRETGYRKMPYSFHLIDMPEPNAFALPGGQIFVTRGMIEMGLNDDELACLLGHEIAHVALGHQIKMQRRATLLNILSQAALLGVMIGAERGNRSAPPVYDPYGVADAKRSSDMIQGTAAAGLILSELLLRSYSREFEDQADDEGQRWAAAAGFDPDGARQLFALMSERLPQDKKYGYWQTHPFFDSRIQAATVRGHELKIMVGEKPDTDVRRQTQTALLEMTGPIANPRKPQRIRPAPSPDELGQGERPKHDDGGILGLLKQDALVAWPRGERADGLRLESLHTTRDRELRKSELQREYGTVIRDYAAQEEEVRELEPESGLLKTLASEKATLEADVKAAYPKAQAVLQGGIYETSFLEVFQNNWPQAPEMPSVALSLGDAYARLNRLSDAVGQYLRSWEAKPDSDAGRKALAGLRNLAPGLDQLAALQQLALQKQDSELQKLSEQRLATLESSYAEISNGAEYLKKYPAGPHAAKVTDRLNNLASSLYGEVVLYQAVGDDLKALERINKILTYAPQSPAADKLRERAVVVG